jgi:hypothetical protein
MCANKFTTYSKYSMDPEKQQQEEVIVPNEGVAPATEEPVEPTPILAEDTPESVSKNTIILLVVSVIIVVLMLLYIWGSAVGQQVAEPAAPAELQVVIPPKEVLVVETPPAPVASAPVPASDEVVAIEADLQALDFGVIDVEISALEAELMEVFPE